MGHWGSAWRRWSNYCCVVNFDAVNIAHLYQTGISQCSPRHQCSCLVEHFRSGLFSVTPASRWWPNVEDLPKSQQFNRINLPCIRNTPSERDVETAYTALYNFW